MYVVWEEFCNFALNKSEKAMKRTFLFTTIIASTLLLGSCAGNTSQPDENDSTAVVSKASGKPEVMNEYRNEGDVEVGGEKFHWEFSFDNDRQLPVVTTDDGLRYYDNHVVLVITQGQATVYEHTFTKEAFRDLIPEADYRRSVLAGFNFNYMQEDRHDRFYFIAVVGDPDETVGLEHSVAINIDRSGAYSTAIVDVTDVESNNPELNRDPDEDDA